MRADMADGAASGTDSMEVSGLEIVWRCQALKFETTVRQSGRVGEAKHGKRFDAKIRDPEMILTFVRTGFRITKREEEKV